MLPVILAILPVVPAPRVRAADASDRVALLARRLLAGRGIIDYDLVLERFSNINDPRVLPVLLRLSEAENDAARASAAGVLWRYNQGGVRKKLVEMLRDPVETVRIEAAKSLCLMGYTANVGVVSAALRSTDSAARCRALRALAAIESPEAVAALRQFKPRPGSVESVWQAFALYRRGIAPQRQLSRLGALALRHLRTGWAEQLKDPRPKHLRRLRKTPGSDLPLRLQAVLALARLGDADSFAWLAKASADPAMEDEPLGPPVLLGLDKELAAAGLARCLEESSALLRLGCARNAGRLRQLGASARRRLTGALAAACRDQARLVRLNAARSLAALGSAEATPALEQLLTHQDPASRREAARALGQLAVTSTVPALLARLQQEPELAVKQELYLALARLGSARAVEPLLARLQKLVPAARYDLRARTEVQYCVRALGGCGEAAARRALQQLSPAEGDESWRQALVEVLAHSGARSALDFFLNRLREEGPDPEGPEVRFFDSLPAELAAELEQIIQRESALWTRLILARALVKMGRPDYLRGLRWGLRQQDPYLRQLAAALCTGVRVHELLEMLAGLVAEDQARTAFLAARALVADGSARAWKLLRQALPHSQLRRRQESPLLTFWEGERSQEHPYAKEVDNERVWVVFADDRLGRKADLFLTWSVDGRVWHRPIFSGLTSFFDASGQVPPPTFSLKVRGRDITIALTNTRARDGNWSKPRFDTRQRVYRYKLQQFFADADGDGASDFEERVLFTNARQGDSDGDGLPDGKDNNPLSTPADPGNSRQLVALAAAARLLLVDRPWPLPRRLLIVYGEGALRGRVPELPYYPGLVLQLSPSQIRKLWQESGAAFPHLVFPPATIDEKGDRAVQRVRLVLSPEDERTVRLRLVRRQGEWLVQEVEQ